MARTTPFKRSIDQAATVYLAAVCALALLALSLPRFVSAVYAIPGLRTMMSPNESADMTEDKFRHVAKSLSEAAVWTDDGVLRRELGVARLRRALADRDEAGRVRDPALLDSAIDALTKCLELKPSDPLGWFWLAYARTVRDAGSRAGADAVKESILTGSVLPEIMYLRIEMALRNWPYFDPADRQLVLRQIRLGWEISRPPIMYLATDTLRVSLIRTALADSPDDLSIFEISLRRLRTTGKL